MKKFICYILILINLFFTGCVEKSVQVEKSEEGRSNIIYNVGKMPEDLVMLKDYDTRQQDLLINLFEGLVTSDNQGKILPALAESWSVDKEETCYTFKLRDKAKWSDGIDITADDFVEFFSAVLNKDLGNTYADQLHYIFGAEDYNKGKSSFSNVAIRAIDKKTLEIRLNYPCSYLLNILAEPIYSLRKINEDLISWKSSYRNIKYSGSFKIKNVSEDKEVVLEKNTEYWNKDAVSNNEIIITGIEGSEAELAAFKNSKVDIFTNPPVSEFKSLLNLGETEKITSYKAAALLFNLEKERITSDMNFRKSIAMAINRSSIVKEILNDTAKIATAYVPPYVSDGANGKYLNKVFLSGETEKEKSLQLLNESKYEGNKKVLKLVYIDTVENKKICESIAKNLNENLKVKIECEGYTVEAFLDVIRKKDYDMAKINYEGGYDYPLAFLEKWTSASDDNLYGYKNIEFDTKITKAKMEKDKIKKIQHLREAEDTLMSELPLTPLYYYITIACKNNKVEGIYTNKRGNIKLDKVYIKGK